MSVELMYAFEASLQRNNFSFNFIQEVIKIIHLILLSENIGKNVSIFVLTSPFVKRFAQAYMFKCFLRNNLLIFFNAIIVQPAKSRFLLPVASKVTFPNHEGNLKRSQASYNYLVLHKFS